RRWHSRGSRGLAPPHGTRRAPGPARPLPCRSWSTDRWRTDVRADWQGPVPEGGGAKAAARPALGQTMAGCTVLVTAERRAAEFAAALERRGATVRHAPALSMIPHVDDETLRAATTAILDDPPDVVV